MARHKAEDSGTTPRAGTASVTTESTPTSADVDRAILDAAEKCFDRFGITKTTMEDVARVATLSRATVYRHFADRESLILACVVRRSRMNLEPARSYIANCTTVEQKIVEGICQNVRSGLRDPMVHLLVSPDEMKLSSRLLWQSGAAIDLTYELWAPIIEEAQMLGEIRRDIDIRLLCEWIAEIEMSYISQHDDGDEQLNRLRQKLSNFLVPSLLPSVTPVR